MKNFKFLVITSLTLLFFLFCNKLKKIDTRMFHGPSTSHWMDASDLNFFIEMAKSRSQGINCLASGVKLPYAACKDSEYISQNGCVSGKLAAGTLKYYRYYAPSDESLSMVIADSTPTSFTNCAATYKENSLVDTNSPVTELETNQSLTSCQANTSATIKSGSYRCISVHSFCDSFFNLKLGNTSGRTDVFGAGNSNLALPNWSTFNTSYTPITGTGTPIIGDNTYWSIPIGFSFTFFGQTFTNLNASSNGLISFGTATPEDYDSSHLFLNKSTFPTSVIAAWWANLRLDCDSNVQYTTTGTTGNRALTVQWKNILLKTYDADESPGRDNVYRRLNFQVKLYETTNVIDLVYGPASGNTNSDELASVGIKNTVNEKVVFINGMNSSSTDTSRFKNISFPASGKVYRFTP